MKLAHALQTVGGLGHMRPASGTWGSMPPPALALGLVWLLGRDGTLSTEETVVLNVTIALFGLLFAVACLKWGRWAEATWGKDPKEVVSDEVAGQCVALMVLPWKPPVDQASIVYDIVLAGGAFIAFRVFDIIKPPPARQLERLGGGRGILFDDLFAGLYAAIAVQAVARLI